MLPAHLQVVGQGIKGQTFTNLTAYLVRGEGMGEGWLCKEIEVTLVLATLISRV